MPPPTPILLAVQQLTQGGSERQLTETAKAIDRSRFQPHVAVFRPDGIRAAELGAVGVPVVCFPFPSFASFQVISASRAMGAYIRRHKIQLVHSFDVPANIFAVPTARLYRTPIVLSSQRAFRSLTSPTYHQLLRLTDRLADGIVVNCRALEKHLIEEEGVPPHRIRLCYNGIDTEVFQKRPRLLPESLAGAALVVGIVCALRPEKGLTTLVEAFAKARSSAPGMRLVIVGSGPMLGPLQKLSGLLGCDGDCVFAPSTAHVSDWLRGIDIFVLPSLSEALSNSLMEAMACGCAVVASRVGGNPELVAHGERGLLFEPGNSDTLARCLTELALDESLRRRLADAGHQFLHKNFPLSTAATTMADIYSGFLSTFGTTHTPS